MSRLRAIEKVERALRTDNMTIEQLANAIVAQRDTVRYALDDLMQQGKVKRELDAKPAMGRTAYRYSLIAPSTQAAKGEIARELVGTWDAL